MGERTRRITGFMLEGPHRNDERILGGERVQRHLGKPEMQQHGSYDTENCDSGRYNEKEADRKISSRKGNNGVGDNSSIGADNDMMSSMSPSSPILPLIFDSLVIGSPPRKDDAHCNTLHITGKKPRRPQQHQQEYQSLSPLNATEENHMISPFKEQIEDKESKKKPNNTETASTSILTTMTIPSSSSLRNIPAAAFFSSQRYQKTTQERSRCHSDYGLKLPLSSSERRGASSYSTTGVEQLAVSSLSSSVVSSPGPYHQCNSSNTRTIAADSNNNPNILHHSSHSRAGVVTNNDDSQYRRLKMRYFQRISQHGIVRQSDGTMSLGEHKTAQAHHRSNPIPIRGMQTKTAGGSTTSRTGRISISFQADTRRRPRLSNVT